MNSLLSEQKLLMSSQGCALQQILPKSIIDRRNYQKNIQVFSIFRLMQKTSSQSKIHLKNINLQKACPITGIIGQKHSKLIDKLTADIETRAREIHTINQNCQQLSGKQKELLKRIESYDREETNLKKQMIRISEMAKSYKNSKIEIQIKNQTLLQQYSKCKRENDQLKLKVDLLTQLNCMLMKIAENSLQIIPHYTNDCEDLFVCIEKVKADLSETSNSFAINDLKKKLQIFKTEMDNIQTFNKKLIVGLAEAQQETKSISQRISLLSDLNIDDLLHLKNELIQLNENASFSQCSSSAQQIEASRLGLYSHVNQHTVIPHETSRINKILQEICLLFEQHIHLLETQKMEYQFTKNKKLITAQKYECEICESYEKIVSQIFSIVREAFKEIKFQFLREIKQVDDISQIPFLI